MSIKKSEAVIQLLQRLGVLDRVRELHKQNKHPKSIEQLFDEGTNIDSMFYFPEEELEYWDIISKMIQIVLDGVDGYNAEEEQEAEETEQTVYDKYSVVRLMKLDGNGYVAEVAGKDYGFEDTERLLTFLMDYLEDSGIVKPENKYFN